MLSKDGLGALFVGAPGKPALGGLGGPPIFIDAIWPVIWFGLEEGNGIPPGPIPP